MSNTLIVIDSAYGYAGTEKACDFLSQALSKDSDVDILSFNGEGDTFYPFRSVKKIININNKKYKYLQLMRLVKSGYYNDVFLISMGKMSVFFSLYCSVFIKKHEREKIKVHSCEHVSLESFPKHVFFLKRLVSKKLDSIIVLTNRDEVIYKSWGANVKVIPNPIKKNNFSRNINNKKMLAIGRLTKQKGFDRLLKIWQVFSQKHPDWNLQLAGDGEDKDKLIKLSHELGVAGSITFLGKVKDTDSLYKSSDVLLMTSYYEGLPMVLLEAQSWGLPVIAYDCPTGPREIIKDGDNGFLIENGNESDFLTRMEVIVENSKLYNEMVSRSNLINPNFDESSIVSRWRDVIKSKI